MGDEEFEIIHNQGRATMHDEILQAVKKADWLTAHLKQVFMSIVEKTKV